MAKAVKFEAKANPWAGIWGATQKAKKAAGKAKGGKGKGGKAGGGS